MRYDYVCTPCGEVTEASRTVADRDNGPICQTCKTRMKRTLSRSTNFILKGSGWEKDGYK